MAKSNRLRDDWGSVSYDPRRKVGRIRYWANTPEGYRRVSKTVHGTRREVERRRAELRLAHDEDAPLPTVGELWRANYVPYAEGLLADGKLAKKTWAQRRSTWRCHVAPRWEDVPCDSVRPAEAQEWLLTMTKKPATDSRSLLRAILDYAVMQEHISRNPLDGRYAMPTAQRSRGDGVYTRDELAVMADALSGTLAEAAYILSAYGSCRTGEALGAKPEDVREVESHGMRFAVVDVCRQVNADAAVSERLKNRWSYRPVVIPDPWASRLLEIAEQGRAEGLVWLSDDGCGRPIGQNAIRREWDAMFADGRAPGIERQEWRVLRRSWETVARWVLRIDSEMVEKMMGHAGTGVTGRHYDRPSAELFVDVVATAWERLRRAESGD